MLGIFKQLKEKILPEMQTKNLEEGRVKCLNNLIALGVLLWVVAESDEHFLPDEKEKIREILKTHSDVSDEDMPIVIRAIEEASINRIDLYSFTQEASGDMDIPCKISLVEDLFRVACADRDLNEKEHEMIRKIANLFRLDHKDFIEAKIKVKRECGMETI